MRQVRRPGTLSISTRHSVWPRHEWLVIARGIAQQLAGPEGLETDRAHVVLASQREDDIYIALVHIGADGKHHDIHPTRRDGCGEHVGTMAGNALKPRLARADGAVELVESPTGRRQVGPVRQGRYIVEDKQVGILH